MPCRSCARRTRRVWFLFVCLVGLVGRGLFVYLSACLSDTLFRCFCVSLFLRSLLSSFCFVYVCFLVSFLCLCILLFLLFVCLFVCLFVYLFVYLFVCLFVSLFVCLFLCVCCVFFVSLVASVFVHLPTCGLCICVCCCICLCTCSMCF